MERFCIKWIVIQLRREEAEESYHIQVSLSYYTKAIASTCA